MFIKLLCLALIFLPILSSAKQKSRPQSIGGDYLLELTMGVVNEGEEAVFEVGVEVERFLDPLAHHCALGFVFETSLENGRELYYTALSASAYYYHYKIYLSSGLFSDFDKVDEWKTRMGFGKEFFLRRDFILVPAFTLDYIGRDVNPGFSMGLAHEF